jgi:hypothetical protein
MGVRNRGCLLLLLHLVGNGVLLIAAGVSGNPAYAFALFGLTFLAHIP